MDLKNIVFMKYGTHANEPPTLILENKVNEVGLCGRTFWGYGGNVCHPINQVQPFIKMNANRGEKTYLVLSRINSSWSGSVSKALFYSLNNTDWIPLPPENVVIGSKFAIICNTFEPCNFTIDLSFYRVAVGNAAGRLLSSYISGRNTKGCGTLHFPEIIESSKPFHISAIAEIESAAFIR